MIGEQLISPETWCFSLRLEMGYPAYKPATNSVAFCASAPKDPLEAMHIASLAQELNKDVVHVGIETIKVGPVNIALATRHECSVRWTPDCLLYAESESAPIQILTKDKAWGVGPRSILTATKLPPAKKRRRGIEIAMRRWRAAAAAMGPVELVGGMHVPNGEPLSAAIPLGKQGPG